MKDDREYQAVTISNQELREMATKPQVPGYVKICYKCLCKDIVGFTKGARYYLVDLNINLYGDTEFIFRNDQGNLHGLASHQVAARFKRV